MAYSILALGSGVDDKVMTTEDPSVPSATETMLVVELAIRKPKFPGSDTFTVSSVSAPTGPGVSEVP
ncbi:hypothetical protein D3C72_2586320 [compost metagenome]